MARWRLLLGLLVATQACATWPSPAPAGPEIYVAPFVDETPGQLVGFPLFQATQKRLWERAPQRFVTVFEDDVLALDVTVRALRDVPAGGTAWDVEVEIAAVLVDKRGAMAYDLGAMSRRGRYQRSSNVAATKERRGRALEVAIETLAGALTDAALAASGWVGRTGSE